MAVTATSLRGVCKGPIHCCCAISPVTHLSTLLVRNLLLHTDVSLRTLSKANKVLNSVGKVTVFTITGLRSRWNT